MTEVQSGRKQIPIWKNYQEMILRSSLGSVDADLETSQNRVKGPYLATLWNGPILARDHNDHSTRPWSPQSMFFKSGNIDNDIESMILSVLPHTFGTAVGRTVPLATETSRLSSLPHSQPWSIRSHIRRDLTSVHSSGFCILCGSDVLDSLLFPISGNCTILVLLILTCVLCPPVLLRLLYLSSLGTSLVPDEYNFFPPIF